MKVALIAGATGLVGSFLLKKLLNDPAYHKVISVGRKPPPVTHDKLQNAIVNFDSLQESKAFLVADDVFCCLGTTMKKAGSKEQFWKVDHDYPLALARISKDNGAKKFLLVSALGADADSSIYYNQVKGRIETAIDGVGFDSYHIFRPSLLLGPRDEKRSGEEAAKTFYRIFDFLIPLKYKGVEGSRVAEAMLSYAKDERPGRFLHTSEDLQKFNS